MGHFTHLQWFGRWNKRTNATDQPHTPTQQLSQLAAMFPDVEPSTLARELATQRNPQAVIERILQGHVPRTATRIPDKSTLNIEPKIEVVLTEAPPKVWEQDAKKRSENLKLRAAWMKQQAKQRLANVE
jgi:hypothetical protein